MTLVFALFLTVTENDVTLFNVLSDDAVTVMLGLDASNSTLSVEFRLFLEPKDADVFLPGIIIALTEGTITKTVEFWVYIAATVGERSIRASELLFILVFPLRVAVTWPLGTVTLYVVPLTVISAEFMKNLTMFTDEFAERPTLPITWLLFTSPIRFSVPLPEPLTHDPDPAEPTTCACTDE